MLMKEITYRDFNGEEKTKKFYFNLSQSEVTMMEMTTEGGLEQRIRSIVAEKKVPEIMTLFRDLILNAYGEKSADGEQFVKNESVSRAFSYTNAYDILFMSLVTDPEAAAKFVEGVLPKPAPQQN